MENMESGSFEEDLFSVKMLMIIIIVTMTVKMDWVGHGAEHFTWIISLTSLRHSMWAVLRLSLLHTCDNAGSKRSNHLSQVTELAGEWQIGAFKLRVWMTLWVSLSMEHTRGSLTSAEQHCVLREDCG